MKKIHYKKRYITLVEMMIVMFLIALITGVLAYNYTGSLEEGKAFKTKAGMEKIKTILSLSVVDGDLTNITQENWKEIVKSSPLVQNSDQLIKDGWGEEYRVEVVNGDQGQELQILSNKYTQYLQHSNKQTLFK